MLKYGVCDCEYPCSCCEFEGKLYGSWKDVIKELIKQRDNYKSLLIELGFLDA